MNRPYPSRGVHLRLTAAISLLLCIGSPALAQDGGQLVPDSPAEPDVPVAESSDRIVEVRVEGNRRVEPEAIKRALYNKEGRAFDSTRTADDLRSLWALKYFADIELLVQRLPKGGIVYVVRVEERPAVREVRLSGNDELSKDDLKDSIDIRPHSILDKEAVRRNVRKIQEKYVEKGYFLAEVTHQIVPVPESFEVDVVFVIREHSKVMVKKIHFLGVEKVDPEELKAVMATREGGYLSFLTGEGTYREEMFQRDVAALQAAYYDRGFVNVKIDKPVVSISPDKKFIYITLKVEEGDAYQIGKLDFKGDLVTEKSKLFELMHSREGETFNRSKLVKDILSLTDVYYDAGYAYANITPVTTVHADTKTIDLTFDIQKGQQVYIERIDIVGNTKTRDRVIRRELRVYEGELFSGTGLRRSKERVTALGFFESVEVSHKPGSDNSKVVVVVEVKEKATGTFQLGLGFSNVENFIFTAQISQNNFLGWGYAVSASAQLSGLRNFVQLSFYDPHFADTDWIFSFNLFRMQADYFGFVRDSTGGDVNLGYHLLEDLMLNFTLTREWVSVEPGREFEAEIPLANQFKSGSTSSIRPSITYDKRDNRLFPSRGFMLHASWEWAPDLTGLLGHAVGDAVGGSFNFHRTTVYGRYYLPVGDYVPFLQGFVLKANATFGWIKQLNPKEPLPISEMYYVGGMNTVRGYQLRSISPTVMVPLSNRPDSTITPFNVGGDKQVVFNLELEFPIFEKVGIRGVLFADAGNAYAPGSPFFYDPQHHLPLGMFWSVGFGFRWFSPIGPLRFEWGIPLTPRSKADFLGGDPPILFEFTIGNSF